MTGSDTASRARSLATDPMERPAEVTTGMPLEGSVTPLPVVSVLPPKEELPTCFEVKARIVDFYPITLDEDCLLRICGNCKKLSVPGVVFSRSFVLNVSLKDREKCRIMSRLFDHDGSSTCDIPLLTFIHVERGKWRRARGNRRKHRCKSCFDDHPAKITAWS